MGCERCLSRACVAWLLLWTALSASDLPPSLTIEMAPVRMQALPASIWHVEMEVAGRVWLMVEPPEEGWTLDQAKAVVEREFARDQPQIIGLMWLGRTRDGRVWFADKPQPNRGHRLLGYDGTGWIEHPDEASVVHAPVELASCVLFPGRSGVGVWNGTAWTVGMKLNGTSYPAKVVREPGGDSAVAYFGHQTPLQRFRDGRWFELSMPSEMKDRLDAIAACRFGLYAQHDETLLRLEGPPDDELQSALEIVLEPLLAQLNAPDESRRTDAEQQILGIGPAAGGLVRLRAAATDDALSRLRLKRVALLLEQKKQPAPEPVIDDGLVAMGSYRVQRISFLRQLKTDHVLVGVLAGVQQDGTPLPPGVLVVPPREPPFYIPDALVNNSGFLPVFNEHGVLRQALHLSDDVVLIPGHDSHKRWSQAKGHQSWDACPALRLDLQRRTLTPMTPSRVTLAIDAHGREYIGTGYIYGDARRYQAIDVMTAGAPDTRLFVDLPDPMALDTRAVGLATRYALATMDRLGRLYTVPRSGGLIRYQGEHWEPIIGAETVRASDAIYIGDDGAVAFVRGSSATLVWNGQTHAASSLEELISQHQPTFAAQFAAGSLPLMHDVGQIVSDAAGRIWVRRQHDVMVFADGQWLKDEDDRVMASSKRARMRFMASVADGGFVYLTNRIEDEPLAYFATVFDGQITRIDAPHSQSVNVSVQQVRDDDGVMWLPASMRPSPDRSADSWRYDAIRVDRPGVEERLRGLGHPYLHDGAGNLLLLSPFTGRQHRDHPLHFVRDGNVVHRLHLPEMSYNPAFVSDRPGSIFTVNLRGLVHLTAADPHNHPEGYRVSDIFYLGDPPRRPRQIFASPAGFIALLMQDDDQLSVYVLALPLLPRIGPSGTTR